jgi:aldehyde dehydrogenase (NAD+)
MGPLVSEVQMKRVLDYIEIGKQEGARLVTGGSRHSERGFYVEPTVFADVAHEMRISQEEIFGPVATVIKFNDDEDALRIANGTVYSLAAGVWTADIGRAHDFTRRLKAGTVWVNTYGPTDIRLQKPPKSSAAFVVGGGTSSQSAKECQPVCPTQRSDLPAAKPIGGEL